MNAKRFLLIRFVLLCLVLPMPLPLLAQRPSPHNTQQEVDSIQKPDAARVAQNLKPRCDEFLKPLRAAPQGDFFKDAKAFNRREEAQEKLSLRFEKYSDEDLQNAEFRVMDCVTDLPDRRSRRDAFDAYILIVREQESRVVKAKDDNYSRLAELAAGRGEEVKKEHNNFLEAAKFAAALWKENEQYQQQESRLLLAIREERKDFEAMYQLAEKAINLAGQAGPSLPAFVYTPPPQVIRAETPAVPRALHCSANTTTAPLLPQGTSTTWVNCW